MEYRSLYSQLWALRSHIKNFANWSGVLIIMLEKKKHKAEF